MDIFYIKLILSFLVGGFWIAGATVLAEKFGSKIGGVITSLPSTIVLALFFIGWTQSVYIASEATTIVPATMGLSAIFTALYILLSRNKLYISIGLPLLFWFIIAFLFVKLNTNNFFFSFIVYLFLYFLSWIIGEKIVKIESQGKRSVKLTARQLLFRCLLGGSVIAFSVLMTRLGGPTLGGVFATFPAIMISTMIITYLSHGRDFSIAMMKVVMISGGVNVVVYAFSVRIFYPLLGLIDGTIISFLISLVSAYFMYQLINRKMT